jgi:dethiobiotin synthetase
MIFVCGTDTGAGKTHTAAAILFRYAAIGARYWKPVQTGTRTDELDEAIVKRLTGLAEDCFVPTMLTFSEPLSPHRAAELESRSIHIETIVDRLLELGPSLIVEGAGGLLVPLNRRATWLDFLDLARARGSEFSVVIAARSGLGTINHSLLTMERLRRENHSIAGIVFLRPRQSGQPTDDLRNG